MTGKPPDHLPAPGSVEELEELLSRPPDSVVAAMAALDGDLAFLGVAGKMGPTMARMARRAIDLAGVNKQVFGVSRFRDSAVRERLESWGIRTIACDLLDEEAVARLPDAAQVVSMSGFKFGASDHPDLAWAGNCYVPALVCRRYRDSRIITFSTGNVYGMVPASSPGSVETDDPRPDGEYAMTALGRERMCEYFSRRNNTPVVLLRLNYATELRYGVLVDLAQQIHAGRPVDVTMGHVNVIWLADANAMTLRAFPQASSPARILNLAGPEIVSVREVCRQLGEWLDRPVALTGAESGDALLNCGRLGHQLLGPPQVSTRQVLRWTADWVARGGPTLGKPTHFQTRTGVF